MGVNQSHPISCFSSLLEVNYFIFSCFRLKYHYGENSENIKKFCVKLMFVIFYNAQTLGTAACPPYHLAIVIGGTSAEYTLKTVKYASTKYLDDLPHTGET